MTMTELTAARLDQIRREFPILQRTTYLNSCSLGALSRRAEDRLEHFLELWHRLGASAWYEHWLGTLDELRNRVARFHGGEPGELALLPSTSAALSVIAESVASEGRNRVVTTELDFPTLPYQWRVKPEIEVVMLRSEDGVGVDPEQFRQAVDERTLFLATSHVYYSTGFVQDLTSLAAIAHRVGAWCLIDGYQGAGQVPVDLPSAGVDVYTSGPLKWLCGGPGLSYLWVRGARIPELRPRITSWFAARDQFDFDPEHFRPREDARRFELGTPALPTVHTALGGQEIVDEIGIEAIHRHNRDLTALLVESCRDAGFPLRTASDPRRRSAIVMIAHPDPAGAVAHLARHDIIVDHRPGHVRVSPHFYNTEGEIGRFVRILTAYAV